MTYADTDFFLALIKTTDWLKSPAKRLFEQYRDGLWTSVVTVIEMLLLSERMQLDPERIVMDVTEIAEVRGVDRTKLLLAAHFMQENKMRTFDALHAAFAQGDEILSSDRVYDRVGLKRIPLE